MPRILKTGPELSLQRGLEDELFGHYWIDFVKQLQNDSCKTTEKGGISSKTGFSKTSSEDPEYISKRIAAEFVETNVFFPSEFEKGREVVGILEDRAQSDSRSGMYFTETQEMREKMLSQMELPSYSKQSIVEPETDKHQKDSENLSSGSSDTEASGRESEVSDEKELTTKQLSNKALTKDKKSELETLHCGQCDTRFGELKSVLGKVMYMCRETEINRNQAFKCLSCSVILNTARTARDHFVNHVKKRNLYCMECQIKMNDGKVIYDLETFDIPTTTLVEEAKLNLPKLYPKTVASLLKLSPSCAACPTSFGDISEKLCRLFEIHQSEGCKPTLKTYIYCCILCSKCYLKLYDIKTHILDHFLKKHVLCRKCYGGVSSPKNLRLISSKQTVIIKGAKRLDNFDTSLKINCRICKHYVSESAVLQPVAVMMFLKSIEGDLLKIRTEKLHQCVLCLNAFNDIEIIKRIIDHIKSNHIVCIECQNTDDSSVASIRKFAPRLGKYKDVKCENCNHFFCQKDLHSHFSAFQIRRTANKRSTSDIYICEFCKRMYSHKCNMIEHIIVHISKEQIFCNSCATKKSIDERLLQQ